LLWRAAAAAASVGAATLLLCTLFLPLLLAAPFAYVAGELVFALLYMQKYQMLSGQALAPGRPLDYDPMEVYEKCLEHLKQASAA